MTGVFVHLCVCYADRWTSSDLCNILSVFCVCVQVGRVMERGLKVFRRNDSAWGGIVDDFVCFYLCALFGLRSK